MLNGNYCVQRGATRKRQKKKRLSARQLCQHEPKAIVGSFEQQTGSGTGGKAGYAAPFSSFSRKKRILSLNKAGIVCLIPSSCWMITCRMTEGGERQRKEGSRER